MAPAGDGDLYDVMDLRRDATAEEVRDSYRGLARVYHPDKVQGSSSGGAEAFTRIHDAYRVLGDPTLRDFYDVYGLDGVQLVERLPLDEDAGDEEEEDGAHSFQRWERWRERRGARTKEEVRQELEARVRQTVARDGEEKNMRRGLRTSFTFGVFALRKPPDPFWRRRWALSSFSLANSFKASLGEQLTCTLGCSSEVQRQREVGLGELVFNWMLNLGSRSMLAGGVTFSGGTPTLSASFSRSLSSLAAMEQTLSWTPGSLPSLTLDGSTLLPKSMKGSMAVSVGEFPGVQVNVAKKRSANRLLSLGGGVQLWNGGGELNGKLKAKPAKDFSLAVTPAVSSAGCSVNFVYKKKATSPSSILTWTLRLRARSAVLRLFVRRGSLRLSVPFALWPDALGPLPAEECAFAVACWLGAPVVVRLAWLLASSLMSAVVRPESDEAADERKATPLGAAATRSPGQSDSRGAN